MLRKYTGTGLSILLALALLLVCAGTLAAQFTAVSDPAALPAEGGSVTISVTVFNDSAYPMEKIVITNNGTRLFQSTEGVVIDAGSSVMFQQSVTVPAAYIGQPIDFNVSWTENDEAKSGSFSVTVLNGGAGVDGSMTPMLSATRAASSSQASQGDKITLTYTLTNNGISPITGVSITDKEIAGREPMIKDITVEPGIPYTFTYEYTMGRSTVTSSPVITYQQPDGTSGTLTVEDKTLGMVKSKISVEVKQATPTAEGQTFTIILTNNGNQKVSKLKLTDELGNSIVAEPFALAIGESISYTYTVPTDGTRNVVFNLSGTDATGTAYSDHTQTYPVKKYIDPSLIGIAFSAEVAEPLDASGSISLNFHVENNGSLEMQNLVLSEAEYGILYQLASVPQGTQTINQLINVGSPRKLTFTLTIEDPSENVYTYTAYITADYVGVEAQATPTPEVEVQGGDLVGEVGSTISGGLRTVLIVLIVLTVIAGVAFAVLTALEKEERRRIARRKAQREKLLRAQLAGGTVAGGTSIPGGAQLDAGMEGDTRPGSTRRIPKQ